MLCLLLVSALSSYAQPPTPKNNTITYSGLVLEKGSNTPIPGATINLPQYGIWVVTDRDGLFEIRNVPTGKTQIKLNFIGKVPVEKQIDVKAAASPDRFYMEEENFGLDEVVVVAKSNKVGASTASSISRSAIDHLQATSLGDVMELLPGALASNPTLTSPSKATLRQVQGDAMNSLGTSIVYNGSPISNNANLQIGNTATEGSLNTGFASTAGSGSDMRQIAVDNIESVDVIRGIPSVEYGDLTSGVIIINPKAGSYPWQARLKINPTLTQASLGKGFHLSDRGGDLSVDVDYAKSLSDERRPYQGFQRFTSNLLHSINITRELRATTGLGFFSDLDATKLDPSDARYMRERRSENMGLKFNTNVVWGPNRKFLKFIRFNLSVNYENQKGYTQEIKNNFGYMITSAMQDGTVTSNRPEIIYDAAGNAITNNHLLDPSAMTNILPYEFLTKMHTYGKPLNVFGKVTGSFLGDIGSVSNRIVVGADWRTDVNFGRGKVFDPLMPPASGLRMRPYTDIPALNQLGLYVEDNIKASILKRDLNLQLGLRYDLIQPGRSEGGAVWSPRINASYEIVPKILTLRGGWGITAKAPPLMYLYPDKAYFDFVNYDNLGEGLPAEQQLSLITTKVYDTSNADLKIATNRKAEVGFDLTWGQMSFAVTAFREKLTNGYSFGYDFDSYRVFDLIKYKGENRPGTYPALEVDADASNRVVLGFYRPLNDGVNETKGLEFDLDFGQFRAIRTSVVLNGAWMQSRLYSTNYTFFQKSPVNGVYQPIGVYGSGDGSQYERLSTTLRIIHNIPKISFVVSLSIQTIWKDEQKYLGTENKTPIGYLSAEDLSYTAVGPDTSADILNAIQRTIVSEREITDWYAPLWLFNLRITKEIRQKLGFAFFVNNMFMRCPLEESKRYPGTYKTRNPSQFFGGEVWVKF